MKMADFQDMQLLPWHQEICYAKKLFEELPLLSESFVARNDNQMLFLSLSLGRRQGGAWHHWRSSLCALALGGEY
jgi:hypothetical protein